MVKQEVSVIIPNYNNARRLTACLDSCLEQKKWVKEIIVIDDHSSDRSIEILEEYSKANTGLIHLYINPTKGANSARNFGFQKSTGAYIQWLDSDDFILPGKFERQVKELEINEADIVYSDFRLDNYNGSHLVNSSVVKFSERDDYLLDLLCEKWNTVHSYLIKREFANKLANGIGWNLATHVGQDREYFTIAGIIGARFQYVPGVFAVYNKQSLGTISGMDFKKRLELNQPLEKRLRHEIENQSWIQKHKKKEYFSILNTHKLKACFYNDMIKLDGPINPINIKWGLMHWKIRMVMPLLLIKKHLELLF